MAFFSALPLLSMEQRKIKTLDIQNKSDKKIKVDYTDYYGGTTSIDIKSNESQTIQLPSTNISVRFQYEGVTGQPNDITNMVNIGLNTYNADSFILEIGPGARRGIKPVNQ